VERTHQQPSLDDVISLCVVPLGHAVNSKLSVTFSQASHSYSSQFDSYQCSHYGHDFYSPIESSI